MSSALLVQIRTKPGEPTFEVEAQAGETVLTLKRRIAEMRSGDGWAAEMNLIRQGQFLLDDLQLGESGVQTGDFLVATGVTPMVITPPTETEVYPDPETGTTSSTRPLLSDPPITDRIDRQ